MVGPGSYNSHISYKKLTSEPCNATLKLNEKGALGAGNYIFIGQNIMTDPEMGRRFPGCSGERPQTTNARKDINE